MAARLEFGLLGDLLVRRDGATVAIAAGRQRSLLAALLLNRGQPVSSDQLIEVLWGSAPPASARVSLHNYVKRLRQALDDAGHERILTGHRGYAISLHPDELDLARFETRLQAARTSVRGGDWDRVATEAGAALALWRGEPLADVESEALRWREVPRLEEMRLQALEAGIQADLRLGRHGDVIPELRSLTQAHPLREQLHALLMLALYQSGRQAEALEVYASVRQALVDELGTEPGTRLREVQQHVLSGAPSWPGPAGQLPSQHVPSDGDGTPVVACRERCPGR